MSTTREDVAKRAGVSTATVSYVVNSGPRPVAPQTRQRVLRAIEELGYHPSAIARSLKTKKTLSVGIVISDILNPVLASIAKEAEDRLRPQGYGIILCNSDESPEREQGWLRELRARRVDGLLLLPSGANRDELSAMIDAGQTVVQIDRQLEGLRADAVLFGNEAGAYQAVRHLIDLGHSRIALLNLPTNLTPGKGRYDGYRRAHVESSLPILPDIVLEGSFKAQEGLALAAQLLDRRPAPTALFAASHRLAQAVLQHAKQRCLQMPEDLALCVFDDVSYFAYTTPSITAITYDIAQFAGLAVQFLIERIDGAYDGPPRTTSIPCHLVVRESTVGSRGRAAKG